MDQEYSTTKINPWKTFRLLGNTPSYFFLIWRWTFWLFAFIWINFAGPFSPQAEDVGRILLIVTFLYTLVITLYTPVVQIFLLKIPGIGALGFLHLPTYRARRTQKDGGDAHSATRSLLSNQEAGTITPLLQTRNSRLNYVIYGLDVVICGLTTYFGGTLGFPPFGEGSPFYRYGFSAAFGAAFTYGYRGGFLAALGYELFILLGLFIAPPGAIHYSPTIIDLIGSFLDVPIATILAAYLARLLARYVQNNSQLQYNIDIKNSLVHLGSLFAREAGDRERLLHVSADQIRMGGHFQYLVIVLVENELQPQTKKRQLQEAGYYISTDIPEFAETKNDVLITRVLQSGRKVVSFETLYGDDGEVPGTTKLYLPLYKDGLLRMIIGAESSSLKPFDGIQEELLTIAGTQLIIALENIQLVDKTSELAKEAERVRIGREIHDGIAQLVYMLSLNSETCTALAQRVIGAQGTETEPLLTSLVRQLERQVKISKQALLETRQYIFSVKPLMGGTNTLGQMLANQVREFERITGLTVTLNVHGDEEAFKLSQTSSHTYKVLQVEMALFRIVQEALNNTYKHAQATQSRIDLYYLRDGIEVEIADDGRGLPVSIDEQSEDSDVAYVYSGHGLANMQARAEELDGTFSLTPIPSGGVKVKVYVPLA